MEALGLDDREVSLVLTDDAGIAALNKKFFRRRGPTNVISFPLDPAGRMPHRLLGDVVISIETARREALGAGLTVMERVLRLAAHGILHIVGYTHERSPREAGRMEDMEERMVAAARSHHPAAGPQTQERFARRTGGASEGRGGR